jgi:hypothetical protein
VVKKLGINTPSACARNGNRKLMGLNKWILAFNPSIVVMSAPPGTSINLGPRDTRLEFTIKPMKNAVNTITTLINVSFQKVLILRL